MTFALLRSLHTIIGDALDDIQRVYADDVLATPDAAEPMYLSPPPSPCASAYPRAPLDFPCLDTAYDATDHAEQLRAHPAVSCAINKIVAAAGQLSATVQTPFLTLMDASMGYHLPSCLRLLEASHTVEILREAGPDGLHVDRISQQNGVDASRLAHVLRLLATHHILRERAPNIFTLNRISSLVDSGKKLHEIRRHEDRGRPEMKYYSTNGIAALIGLNTDDLQKTAAYMTEAYLLSRANPTIPPFQYAFGTDVSFFPWLEGEGGKLEWNTESQRNEGDRSTNRDEKPGPTNSNRYRLERFGAAMQGTGSWEVPGAVLHGFDWRALPYGSVIVDVGGGIGSTSMLLADVFARSGNEQDRGFRFVIQDRPVVVEMGEKAWRAKYPELLDSGTAIFQVHDFFTTQPVKDPAVFLLRVVLHDWADLEAHIILLQLRKAAGKDTKLLLADFVLPLACPDHDTDSDDVEHGNGILEGVEGAEQALAPAPLLANLGKASSHAYWMDMTMQTVFNAKERTLREIVQLARSAGWKVVKVTKAEGSLFGHITAVPVEIPAQIHEGKDNFGRLETVATEVTRDDKEIEIQPGSNNPRKAHAVETLKVRELAPRAGTPTFGSRSDLPSVQEISRLTRLRTRVASLIAKGRGGGASGSRDSGSLRQGIPLLRQPALSPTAPTKKKPSPLSFPRSPSPTTLERQTPYGTPGHSQTSLVPIPHGSPPSPMSPMHPYSQTTARPLETSGNNHHHGQPMLRSSATATSAASSRIELNHPTTPVRPTVREKGTPSSSSSLSLSRHSRRPSMPSIPRKMSLSFGQQPQPPQPQQQQQQQKVEGRRKRSGSTFGASINGVANFLSGRRNGTLNFGGATGETPAGWISEGQGAGAGSALAEAAEIERGIVVGEGSPSP